MHQNMLRSAMQRDSQKVHLGYSLSRRAYTFRTTTTGLAIDEKPMVNGSFASAVTGQHLTKSGEMSCNE